MASVLVSVLCYFSYSNAQDIQTTNNLVTNVWNNALTGNNYTPGGTSGGNRAAYNPSTNTIMFGYTQQTVSQQIGIATALENSGSNIRIHGYSYSLEYINSGLSKGTASFDVDLKDPAGFSLQKDTYTLVPSGNWTTVSGIRSYNSSYGINVVGSYSLSLTGKDDRYWAGYYGPQVRNVNFGIRYVPDECVNNPLYSPNCAGYTNAYKNMQCNINPLYDASCPGYFEAYKNQQCAANPLYDPTCPGYQIAYFNQQCSLNPLYNTICPGYQQAYFTQQCTANPLYNKDCPGYQQAYFSQQCTANPLYSAECPGYAQAYFDQQCSINSLYNTKCAGYQQAYFSQQCLANPLYNSQCPGYQQAYFNQQCTLNPLYNIGCSGYQQAYLTQQCNANTLYSPSCPGYAEAYKSKLVADSCQANPQSNPQCPGYKTITTTTAQTTSTVTVQDPVASITAVAIVSDPIVNQTLNTSTTGTTSPTNPISPINNIINSQPQLGSGLTVPGLSVRPTMASARERARQEAAQTASRAEKANQSAQEKEQAATMAAMGTVPGFDAYQSAKIPDAVFYASKEIYRNNRLSDNLRAQRQLNQLSDRIHKEMVDSQYNIQQ